MIILQLILLIFYTKIDIKSPRIDNNRGPMQIQSQISIIFTVPILKIIKISLTLNCRVFLVSFITFLETLSADIYKVIVYNWIFYFIFLLIGTFIFSYFIFVIAFVKVITFICSGAA